MTKTTTGKNTRIELDGLGSIEVPTEAYWGASTQRAKDNFSVSGREIGGLRSLIWALGAIKKAAAQANEELRLISPEVSNVIQQAAIEVMSGELDQHFVVDRIQGGAGTSTNMNANEVIANRASELLQDCNPSAPKISPLDQVNRSQSTNDVYPTAIRMALQKDLRILQQEYAELADSFAEKSRAFRDILKVGRTQLQDAVPMTLGQEFGAFASALRDECDSIDVLMIDLQAVNLGGTAIGTGITAADEYRLLVIRALREVSGLDLRSAKNLIKETSDATSFLSASATLRRGAVKLSKICNDLRLLSSGPQAGIGEIILPAVQPGSSIMPGKVNPVIPEMVNQVAFRVIGTDVSVTMAAEAGQLQLNAFEPIMVDQLTDAISFLTRACKTLRTRCVDGIRANEELLSRRFNKSVGLVTALTPEIGYLAAAEIAQEVLKQGGDILEKVVNAGILTQEQLARLTSVAALTGTEAPQSEFNGWEGRGTSTDQIQNAVK